MKISAGKITSLSLWNEIAGWGQSCKLAAVQILLKFLDWRGWVLLLGIAMQMVAAPVPFKAVQATFHGGAAEALLKTIDGKDASADGWCVTPKFNQKQSILFVAEAPVDVDLLNLTMFFMSGRPNASFADFSVHFTTDPDPSFDSVWEDLPILNYGATYLRLGKGQGSRLLAAEEPNFPTGTIPDNMYWITARTHGKAITGFRINVFPVKRGRAHAAKSVMSWAPEDGDFVLTEFAAEVISTTTNVALGTSVTASHPLFSQNVPPKMGAMTVSGMMSPGALTDGWPSTIAHPEQQHFNKDFYFEIDLGKMRALDHLSLRQRGDVWNLDRFGKMRVRLYELDPKTGAEPVWEVLHRADGSFPKAGGVDTLEAAHGEGTFNGRYLRISSESGVVGAPMLAEVEAYETRTPRLVSVKADYRSLPRGQEIQVPPGVLRLGIQLDIPQSGKPRTSLFRWRIKEISEVWLPSDSLLLEIPCPPAGDFTLQVQAGHSDGTWDASQLTVPMTVLIPFTSSRTFFWLMAGTTLAAGGTLVAVASRRRISGLQTQAALSAERNRIARDMHDDVGARLSQLSFMLKALHSDASLPVSARENVEQITDAASEALGSLDEVVWTVNPKNDRLDALCRHLCSHATRYLGRVGIACRIESAAVWPDIGISSQVRHQVTMAFKEALQNVIKHAKASEVTISLAIEQRHFLIRVSDNGCGLPEHPEKSDRNGLENMKSRLVVIGGICDIQATKTGGAEVVMRVPVR